MPPFATTSSALGKRRFKDLNPNSLDCIAAFLEAS